MRPTVGPLKFGISQNQIFIFNDVWQGGAKRLPNYHLVGENCVLVGENLFDLRDLVGENICLLKIYVA